MCVCLIGRYGKADKLGSNIRVQDVVHLVDKRKGLSMYVQAKFVVDTLNRYMSSDDELITTRHVPEKMLNKHGKVVAIDHAGKMVKH